MTPLHHPRNRCDVDLLRCSAARSIAPGKRADLLFVEGNPAEHISDIRRCRLVMNDGALYKSADLYSAAGIKPAD